MMWLLFACAGLSPEDSDTDEQVDIPASFWVGESPVLINEICPDNGSLLTLGAETPDWLELYNASDEIVVVNRLTLSVDGAAPVGITGDDLQPGEHRVFWADEQNLPNHLGFKLSKDGGTLHVLVDGKIADQSQWDAIGEDVVWARVPDKGPFHQTIWSTPGNVNRTETSPTLDPANGLYQSERFPVIEMTLPEASWNALQQEPYEEVPGSFALEGAYFPTVGIRRKGVYGSLRDLNQKAAFKIDFDEYVDGGRIRNKETFTLNNMVQDPSYLHEWMTYRVFRAAGLPAPRTGWAQVYMNGEYFGFYAVIETVDKDLMEVWYDDPTGPIFEGAYGADFYPGDEHSFELDEGEETDFAYLTPICDLFSQPPTDAMIEQLDELVDIDQFMRVMAIEFAAMHWDGYTTHNNYRIYRDPSDGRFDMLPWGTDQTWMDYGYGAYGAGGLVFAACVENDGCRARYQEQLREIADVIEGMPLHADVERVHDGILPYIESDPRRETDLGTHQSFVQRTLETVDSTPQRLRDAANE